MLNKQIRSVLFASVAALAVTACGADDVASPGEGNLVVLPTPAPTPAPTPTPTPTPGSGPAASCPTGTANVGTITTGNGEEVRNCQISGIITGNLLVPKKAGTIYSFSGEVDVGIDGGATGIITFEPGVTVFGNHYRRQHWPVGRRGHSRPGTNLQLRNRRRFQSGRHAHRLRSDYRRSGQRRLRRHSAK